MFHLLTLYRWLRRNGLRNVVEREVQIVQDKQFEIGSPVRTEKARAVGRGDDKDTRGPETDD
jgi:hypothetical protein